MRVLTLEEMLLVSGGSKTSGSGKGSGKVKGGKGGKGGKGKGTKVKKTKVCCCPGPVAGIPV